MYLNAISRWLNYFTKHQQASASEASTSPLDYGSLVHETSMVPHHMPNGELSLMRFAVHDYENEFNVFIERKKPRQTDKEWVACFKWKNAAIEFALQSMLVATRKMKHNDFIV